MKRGRDGIISEELDALIKGGRRDANPPALDPRETLLLQFDDQGPTWGDEFHRMGFAIPPVNFTCLHFAMFMSSALCRRYVFEGGD